MEMAKNNYNIFPCIPIHDASVAKKLITNSKNRHQNLTFNIFRYLWSIKKARAMIVSAIRLRF